MKVAFFVLTIALVSVVAARGRGLERWSAIVLVLASLVSPLVQKTGFVSLEVGIMLVDMMVLIFLVTISLVSDKFWPLWAAGFELVGVVVHLARLTKSDVWFFAYSNAEIFWAYPVYLTLMIGAVIEAPARPR